METTGLPLKFTIRVNAFCFISMLTLLTVFFLASSTMAESWYIKPSIEVPLRRGQGTDYKILAIVPDGTKVTIVEENDPWAKVVSDEGKEGWILKRFLSQAKPLIEVVETLVNENESLKDKLAAVTLKNEKLVRHNGKLQEELDSYTTDLKDVREKYQTLTQDTANVILIKNNLTESKQITAKTQQELSVMSAENKQLKASQNIKWFLAGGGTLIFGCIIGMISSRSRKRKSSLY